jgi:hypothetical protein
LLLVYHRNAILELVESAENAHRLCSCGAPMVPADEAGALWLLCSNRPAPRSLRSKLTSLDWLTPHDRSLLLEADELAAA